MLVIRESPGRDRHDRKRWKFEGTDQNEVKNQRKNGRRATRVDDIHRKN